MTRRVRLPTLAMALAALAIVATGPTAAHSEHQTHGLSPAIPAAVFLASLLVLGTGLYLDRREDVPRRWSDLGVGLGVLGGIVSIGLMLV